MATDYSRKNNNILQMEKEMATHSRILAWRIPWTEQPGGIQSTGLQRVGYDSATSLCMCNYSKSCAFVGFQNSFRAEGAIFSKIGI